MLAQGVNNPHSTGGLGKRANTAQRLQQLGEFALLHEKFFFGVTLSGVLEVNFFEFLHPAQTLGDGLEVGQQTTQPTLVDVGLAHAGCLLGNGFLSLLLRSHEQDGATVCHRFLDELIGTVNKAQRLLQVDDVNPAALSKNKTLNFRVPATSLVTEVDTTI